jgi:hypothetical protein
VLGDQGEDIATAAIEYIGDSDATAPDLIGEPVDEEEQTGTDRPRSS